MRILQVVHDPSVRVKVLDLAKRRRICAREDGEWIEFETGQADPTAVLMVMQAAGIWVPALVDQLRA